MSTPSPQSDADQPSNMSYFANEINSAEIKLHEVVGKGTFGVVRRGWWRDKEVAVKQIETEMERKAFQIELRQLSRVSHPNIVRLYGACQENGFVALVMEYAEGGSLYNVLHSEPLVNYTLSHAISWVLQCARGVSYLHAMQPKALIHRDLKPPNLLLVNGGTVLKICDFGTACDIHTHMTNNKGSAAWMAPEVFESCNYTEKCDVFSWGIILWEVLSRKKPFDDIGGPAFRIMWAVHNGTRPPLLRNCPKVIEELMTKCWSKDPNERPPMKEVESIVENIFKFCSEDANIPIVNIVSHQNAHTLGQDSISSDYSLEFQTQMDGPLNIVTEPPGLNMSSTNILESNDMLQNRNPALSVPPALSGLLSSGSNIAIEPLRPRNPSVKGHKRSNSSGTPVTTSVNTNSTSLAKYRSIDGLSDDQNVPPKNQISDIKENANNSRRPELPKLTVPPPLRPSNQSIPPAKPLQIPIPKDFNAYLVLEPNLQPIQPDHSSEESVKIFEEHKRLSQEYLKMKMEVTLLTSRKQELEASDNTISSIQEYFDLKEENNSLLSLKENLNKQLNLIKQKQRQREATADGDWVLVDGTDTQNNGN